MFGFHKKQPTVGIDISDYSIEALQLNKKKSIVAYARVTLETGIVRDGEIINKEELVKNLKELLKNLKRTRGTKLKVVFSLPESKVFIHHFEIPSKLEDEELKREIDEKALKIIPFNINQIYWDYTEIPRPSSPSKHILFVAAPKKIVDSYIDVMYLAGLEPAVLDIESNSLSRSLLFKSFSKKLTSGIVSSMVIDIGSRATTLSIFDSNDVLNLSVVLPAGGNHFTEAIADKLKIRREEAEKLKRELGFQKDKGNKILPVLEAGFKNIIKEIKDAIEYYEKNSKEKVREIVLAGGSSLLPNLEEYLTEKFQIKVVIGNPLARIKSFDQLKKDKQNPPILFANVIGLALKGLEESGINLLREVGIIKEKRAELKKKKVYLPLSFSFAFFGLLILGIVLYFYILKPLLLFTVSPEANYPEIRPKSSLSTIKQATSTEESVIIKEEEPKEKVLIQNTPTGWLNVREGPGTNYPIITKVYPGENYALLDESGEWVKIDLDGKNNGWVFGRYIKK